MAALVGLSSTGPTTGGLFAAVQSAAMGGSVAPLVGMGGIVAAFATLPVVVGAFVAAEYTHSQQHGMGEPTPDLSNHPRFVLVVHNWGTVQMHEFGNFDEALQAFNAGLNLRRFLVRVHDDNEAERDNGHGWMLPWHELHHDGNMAFLDDGMRTELLKRVRL
jgi:hypothetical protein